MLPVVGGLVGAGKSFAAQALGLALSMSMAGLPLREPGPASLYTAEGVSRTSAEDFVAQGRCSPPVGQ